jgi:hypothetical protein
MEYDSDMQKAYNKLGLDLDELFVNLRKLRNNTHVQTTTTKEIDDRIDMIISEVNSAKKSLALKNEPIIRKDISIAQSMQQVTKAIATFSRLAEYSSDELDALVGMIEQIWRQQIQVTFSEAMK